MGDLIRKGPTSALARCQLVQDAILTGAEPVSDTR